MGSLMGDALSEGVLMVEIEQSTRPMSVLSSELKQSPHEEE